MKRGPVENRGERMHLIRLEPPSLQPVRVRTLAHIPLAGCAADWDWAMEELCTSGQRVRLIGTTPQAKQSKSACWPYLALVTWPMCGCDYGSAGLRREW